MEFSFTKEKEVKRFFILFYLIGLTGMIIPVTHPIFKELIPFSLILNVFYLFYFHPDKKNRKSLSVFFFIFLAGLFIEILGVKTGKIFGHYHYGNHLGPKIMDTPLLIGINWLFLIYATSSITDKYPFPVMIKIFFASGLMLVYDFFLEQNAARLGMWFWENRVPPVQNYLAWFVLSLIFHSIIKLFRINTLNPLSLTIWLSQLVFFIFLSVLLP